jgi:hypothetical protein
MLCFSKVEIDPDRIEIGQIERLKQFKEKTYPKGLVEHYRKIVEFRDKFSKQLELKVRDIQPSEAYGKVPLSLEFLSGEAFLVPGRNHRSRVDRISGSTGKSIDDERVADGSV